MAMSDSNDEENPIPVGPRYRPSPIRTADLQMMEKPGMQDILTLTCVANSSLGMIGAHGGLEIRNFGFSGSGTTSVTFLIGACRQTSQ